MMMYSSGRTSSVAQKRVFSVCQGTGRISGVKQPHVSQRNPICLAEDNKGSRVPDPESIKRAAERLKKDGVDEKLARKVLQSWSKDDVKDAGDLRQKLVKAGVSVVGLSVLQLSTDIFAAYCSSATATLFSSSTAPGPQALEILFTGIFFYFAIGAVFDLFRLGAVIGTASSLGANSNAIYAAVEELAGGNTGLGIVDKAQAAVSSTKVVLALNSIRRVFKEEMDGAEFTKGTLAMLNATLVLQHAEKTYGWEAAQVSGLSQEDAMTAAGLFAKYDANEDFRLEMYEFKRICEDAEYGLSESEVKAAMALLDKRGSGYIEFDEFVSWWAGMAIEVPIGS